RHPELDRLEASSTCRNEQHGERPAIVDGHLDDRGVVVGVPQLRPEAELLGIGRELLRRDAVVDGHCLSPLEYDFGRWKNRARPPLRTASSPTSLKSAKLCLAVMSALNWGPVDLTIRAWSAVCLGCRLVRRTSC